MVAAPPGHRMGRAQAAGHLAVWRTGFMSRASMEAREAAEGWSVPPPAEGDGGGTQPERDRRPAARKEAGRYRERERRMFWKSLMAAWGSRNTPRKRKESGKLLIVHFSLSGVFLQKKSDRQKCLSGPNVGSKTFTAI